jgi:dTMP kinase
MDLGLSRDLFESFVEYQSRMQAAFRQLQKTYGFEIIDANRPVETVARDLRKNIQGLVNGHG